jgi:hypothetical protein
LCGGTAPGNDGAADAVVMIQVDTACAQAPVHEVPVHKIRSEHEVSGYSALYTEISVQRVPGWNICGIQPVAGLLGNLDDAQRRRILATLIRQSGTLVTRDELRRALWPADTFVDFEHGLNAAIKRLREALGDSATAPRFIQTIPRRGYRFIATNETITSTSPVYRSLPVLKKESVRKHWWLALGGFAAC